MPFACIFVPNFPVEAILRAEPYLRSQALAVLEGKAPLQKVFAVNENAHRAGIEPGMTRLQVETCPEITLRNRSPRQESTAHAALLDCAKSFSPRVEALACDTILLDLAGLQGLFGPLPEIAHAIVKRLSDFGIKTNLATASNPDTAMLAARGFSGATIIPDGKEAERLESLPVHVLWRKSGSDDDQSQLSEPRIFETRIFETLERWGVRTLRELASLPDVQVSERLGQAGLHLQQLARGTTQRTLVPVESPLIFEEIIELEHPILLLEPLAFFLNRMLEQIFARLEARALATQELRLEFELQNGWHEDDTTNLTNRTHFCRTLRLPVPLLDPKTFLKLLQLDLNANPPGAPISKICLSAEPTRPRAAQNDLFLPPAPEPQKLELTLAKIASIVGEDKVGSLQLLDTHRPEGFCMQRFAPAETSAGRGPHAYTAAVTALRIFRPPWRVSVTLRNGTPSSFTCPRPKKTAAEILWSAGPWRSCGDWWEHDGWARDEWDIAVPEESSIALYRMVHDRLNGGWFVEGEYD
jgi:protein ImuB